MDWVEVEPTTSAYSKMLFITYLENIMKSDNLAVQIPPGPHLTILDFQMGSPLVVASHQEQ